VTVRQWTRCLVFPNSLAWVSRNRIWRNAHILSDGPESKGRTLISTWRDAAAPMHGTLSPACIALSPERWLAHSHTFDPGHGGHSANGQQRHPTLGMATNGECRVRITTGIKLRGPEGAQRLRATSASIS
jgi:hypothetical protein